VAGKKEKKRSTLGTFLIPFFPMAGSAVWNDRYIVDDVDDLDCAICSCVVHDAVRVDCCSKQVYCAECILRWKSDHEQEAADKATCPLCRQPLITIEAAMDIRRRVELLPTRCLYDACKWRGARQAWDTHVTSECTYSPPREDGAGTNRFVEQWILGALHQPVSRTLVRMWIACRQLNLVASETGPDAERFCERRLQALATRTRIADFTTMLRYIDRYIDSTTHAVMAHRLFAFLVNECIAKADSDVTNEALHQLVLANAEPGFPMVTSCALI
jgi:hypothetical protein